MGVSGDTLSPNLVFCSVLLPSFWTKPLSPSAGQRGRKWLANQADILIKSVIWGGSEKNLRVICQDCFVLFCEL